MNSAQRRKSYEAGDTVLITGASKGLGKELAFECARHGFRVMLCARNQVQLETNCKEISDAGGIASFISCDVTSREEMLRAVEFTQHTFGRIDIAILNAGIGIPNRFSDFKREDFDAVLATNLTGVINGLEFLIP